MCRDAHRHVPYQLTGKKEDVPQAVLYTDFDGVINAFGTMSRPITAHDDTAFGLDMAKTICVAEGHAYLVQWSGELVAAMAELATAGLVELAWLSTWQPFTGRLEQALGWDHVPVETVRWYDPVTLAHLRDGKFAAIQSRARHEQLQQRPLPIIWVDDEECTPQRRDLLQGMGLRVPMLMVRPDSRIGISRRQWSLIVDFLSTPERYGQVTLDEEATASSHDGHFGY